MVPTQLLPDDGEYDSAQKPRRAALYRCIRQGALAAAMYAGIQSPTPVERMLDPERAWGH